MKAFERLDPTLKLLVSAAAHHVLTTGNAEDRVDCAAVNGAGIVASAEPYREYRRNGEAVEGAHVTISPLEEGALPRSASRIDYIWDPADHTTSAAIAALMAAKAGDATASTPATGTAG